MFEIIEPDYTVTLVCAVIIFLLAIIVVLGKYSHTRRYKKKHNESPKKSSGDFFGISYMAATLVFVFWLVGSISFAATVFPAQRVAEEKNTAAIEQFFEDRYVGEFTIEKRIRAFSEVEDIEGVEMEVTIDEGYFIYELTVDEAGNPALGHIVGGLATTDYPELVKKEGN